MKYALRCCPLVLGLVSTMSLVSAPPVHANDVDELLARQKKVQRVVSKVMPAVVGIARGNGAGSGVIVSKDGYVLTAAHVIGQPDQQITIIMNDGRRVKAKSLGMNRGRDAGLVKIVEEGTWPHVEMGKSSEIEIGQWCVAMGHPGGFQRGRTPPVRIGKVLRKSRSFFGLITDATLVGGDSGGPLFDLDGRVIGIHSSIGGSVAENRHVPVDAYHQDWDRMVKGDAWGRLGQTPVNANGGFLGIGLEDADGGVGVSEVRADTAAAKAGIQVGDIVMKFDGKDVGAPIELMQLVGDKKPGDKVRMEIRRGEETLKLEVELGRRPTR